MKRSAVSNAIIKRKGGDLLQGFAVVKHQRRLQIAKKQDSIKIISAYDTVMKGFAKKFEAWKASQKAHADCFNVMDLLQLINDEVRHSMVLAWLLDNDMTRFGTHAQGNAGFKVFCQELDLPLKFSDASYWVRREVAGDKSRIDIEIAARGMFLIHIENKIWARNDQTREEWNDMQRRAKEIGVRDENCIIGYFLTPDGALPDCEYFHAIKWDLVAKVFEGFAEVSEAPNVEFFCRNYVETLHKFIIQQSIEGDLPDAAE